MNTDKEQSASTNGESLDDIRTRKQKEYDAKKSVSFPDEFKSDAEKLLDCRERITVLEDLLDHYRADFTASFNEIKRLRKVIQDNA